MARVEKIQYITQGNNIEDILLEAEQVILGGCKWIQLRMKDSPDSEIIEVGKKLKSLCTEHNTTLIINDNVDICKEIDADGVHLGKEDISTAQARKILGQSKIIGRTCNTSDDIAAVCNDEIDYIGLGPVRFTTTKKKLSPVIGIDGYENILKESNCDIAVVAVGGVTIDDIKILQQQGVYGVAISGIVYKSIDRTTTMRQFIEII